MDPLPMAPSCALDEDGLRLQYERHRQAGAGARLVDRSPRRLVVDLDHEYRRAARQSAHTAAAPLRPVRRSHQASASDGIQRFAAVTAVHSETSAGGYLLPDLINSLRRATERDASEMMGSVTQADMATYTDLFDRHSEIRRTVEPVPGGIRTVTESDAPDLVAQLQAHVSSMYSHLTQGVEVICMSQSLPTLFRNAGEYRRELALIAKGVAVMETSSDPKLTNAIRGHPHEVSGFVREGMPAMMRGMT